MSKRFLKYIPSEKSSHLRSTYPFAFLLLQLVAERARRTPNDPSGLDVGEAYIGDHKSFGATRQQYRTALKHLVDKQFLEIIENCRNRKKSTTGITTVGTKVKLIDNSIWDINCDYEKTESTTESTTAQPPPNHRLTTNKKDKNVNIEEEQQPQTPSSVVVFSCLEKIKDASVTQKHKEQITVKHANDEKMIIDAVACVTHEKFEPEGTLLKSLNAAIKGKWKPTAPQIWDIEKNKELGEKLERYQGNRFCNSKDFLEIVMGPASPSAIIIYQMTYEKFVAEIEKQGKINLSQIFKNRGIA